MMFSYMVHFIYAGHAYVHMFYLNSTYIHAYVNAIMTYCIAFVFLNKCVETCCPEQNRVGVAFARCLIVP